MRLPFLSAACFVFTCASSSGLHAQNTPTQAAVQHASPHSASRLRSLGQVRKLQHGSSEIVRTVDAAGHVVKVIEPDAKGKPTLVTDISYNQSGAVTRIVQHGHEGDAARVRTFTYDEKGRVISATSPEAGSTAYTYDQDGNMASKKDALGQTVTYTWDAQKRLLSKTFTDDTASSSFHYDENTKDHSSYLDVSGKHQSERIYRYDDKGRLTSLSMQAPGQSGATYTLGFRYDDSHRRKTITYPDGTEVQETFTSTGLLKRVSHEKSVLFSKPEYLVPSGRMKAVTLGDGIVLSREYDKHSRVQRMLVTASSGSLLDESFEYTDSGSVRRLTDNLKSFGDMLFGYDELQRVKTTEGTLDEAYVYDSFGNQALKAGGATSQLFDEHNRITGGAGIAYDAAGQVTNDGIHNYRYDGNGLITGVDGNSIRYFYDAEGNRIQKRMIDGNHDYLWWNDQLLAERAPDGTWTDYVYANGGRFASIHKTGAKGDASVEVAYFVTGAVGTSRIKIAADGTALERGTFAAFGKPVTRGSETAEAISFSDEVHDVETGLDTYKFRSYNPRLGRWMSPDPSSLHFASLGNPQTYNLYAFVTNDPLKFIDLHGLQSYCGENDDWDGGDDGCDDGGGGGGGGGADDPPPTDDPCAYDACVVADPDPPVDPDPVPPFDPTVDCTDGECFGNAWGPYDPSPTADASGTPYNTSSQICTTGNCSITIYYGANPFGNVCSGLHGTNGAVASVYSVWDCQGTLADCQNNQAKFRNDCYDQHQTPLDPQYGFGGQGSGGSFYYQACCSVP